MAHVMGPPAPEAHLPPSGPVPPASSTREHSSGGRRHSTGSNNGIAYAKTWAKDVQNYHAAKSVLPWLPEQQKPVKHVTRYEKSREEREYDIVLGRFRDEDKEQGYQQREGVELKRTLEKGRAKQLRTIQRFHMITNAPMYPGAKNPTDKQPVPHPYRKKSAAEYNIVTNIPYNGTSGQPASTAASPSRKPYREFNILTNKYHDRHDDRFEQDAAQAKRIAAQKYFKTRTFDPVRITYVDEDREKEFVARRHEEQQIHGKDRVLVLPPREQFSEGRLYNILNQRVINSAKLTTMNEKDQRVLNKIKKTAYETKMREVGENQQARETDLCLNRYAHERHIQSHVHGYDVLSNQPYAGRDAKPIVHPRTHAQLTAWQTIESGLVASNRIAPKSSPSAAVVAARPPSHPVIGARGVHTGERKPNILIVDQTSSAVQSLKLPPTSEAAQTVVRTGGFQD
ncbi:hypothetical protein PR001_g1624 [Phytophthora rubi]|uniref:Uncharacterized protein n=1 Tax=Phytophthora rubi TaxID=129364 RepID=A0A6A3P014_9STRA|nr:hypothetical protein PR002_g1690 [Phytophthora rubi]KAE9051259.1 hypothetical protein PR001_g1624 [Phytophthora rubi]